MERNLFQRVEVAFPLLDAAVCERVRREGIEVFWEDRAEAWEMRPDGGYALTVADQLERARHPQRRIRKKINK